MRVEYTKGERASRELIMLQRQSSEAAAGRKMKVMLIFPPDWFPSEPYLSLPSLTAVLRQAGHQVVQKDINLEMWDWYFSEDFLKKVLRKVPQQLDRLRKLAKKRELEDWEQDLQLQLCEVSRQRIDELIKKAEQAKAIIRGEIFYEIDQLEWAIQVFREVTSVISLVYAPARICMPPMETNLSYKVFVSSEVIEAVNDTQVNIYRDVFEQLVKPAIEVLAGIPTIVYGLFALVTVGPLIRDWLAQPLGLGTSSSSVLTAGLVMGIMIIPFVSSLSDDIINAVPQTLRDGSYGLGATQSETIKRVILPAALPGQHQNYMHVSFFFLKIF